MRNFGNIHYSGWYKRNNTSHERYYDFLTRLRNEFDARGLYRKRDAVSKMQMKLNQGKTPQQAQNASRTSGGYAPPLYSDFNSAWGATNDMDTLVEAFASGDDVAVMSDDGEFESGPSPEEVVAAAARSSSSGSQSDFQARQSERQAERQARIASGQPFVGRQAASLDIPEEESFFAQYRTPIVLGSALALAGGAYYFFVVRD